MSTSVPVYLLVDLKKKNFKCSLLFDPQLNILDWESQRVEIHPYAPPCAASMFSCCSLLLSLTLPLLSPCFCFSHRYLSSSWLPLLWDLQGPSLLDPQDPHRFHRKWRLGGGAELLHQRRRWNCATGNSFRYIAFCRLRIHFCVKNVSNTMLLTN